VIGQLLSVVGCRL